MTSAREHFDRFQLLFDKFEMEIEREGIDAPGLLIRDVVENGRSYRFERLAPGVWFFTGETGVAV